MKKILALALLVFTSFVNAEIINCDVTVKNNELLKVSIFIPSPQSLIVGLYNSDSDEFDSFVSIDEVTKGSIQITSASGNKREYDFIVTRFPDRSHSLVGYYINQGYIASVKANLWDNNKPIYIHDTGSLTAGLMIGSCM